MKRAKYIQQLHDNASKQSKLVHQGSMISLMKDTLITADGKKTHTYDIIRHPGGVVILPINAKGEILFVAQYRYPVNDVILELPAGCIDPGEDPLMAAKRELREETGFQSNHIHFVCDYLMAPGYTDERLHLFLAQDLSYAPLIAEDSDTIDLFPCSLDAALKLIQQKKINDVKTIASVLQYKVYHL
ncbi:MAG: NUDIX hydrolase [Chlamydiales bacterium]|nr:NUDIX hydrolase [Chlamydiales bacterium]